MEYNFRSINDVPVADSLETGDKVILNSGGVAKQIYASMIGGGSGGTIYAELIGGEPYPQVGIYADESLTEMLTYEHAKQMFKSGAVLYGTFAGTTAVLTPLAITLIEEAKSFYMYAFFDSITQFIIVCEDTIIID